MKESDIAIKNQLILEKPNFSEVPTIFSPLGAELFFLGQENSSLSSCFYENKELKKQVESRRKLYRFLKTIFKKVPDYNLDLEKAHEKGLLKKEELINVYDLLSDFLEEDPNNGRILLYLPFQIIPDLKNTGFEDEKLLETRERFADNIRKSWLRLLYESDVRASFTDGDVLEPGLGIPRRVRKAGHLLPELLNKNVIRKEDVFTLLEIISDEELLESLTEGIVVAKDRGLFDESSWEKIKEIGKEKKTVFYIISSSNSNENKDKNSFESLDDLSAFLLIELEKIEKQYQKGSPYLSKISPKRAKWEKEVKKDRKIDYVAEKIIKKIQKGEILIQDLENFCEKGDFNLNIVAAGLKSIFIAIENQALEDKTKANALTENFLPLIFKYWNKNINFLSEIIISGISKIKRLNIINEKVLHGFGVELVDLSSPNPVEAEKIIPDFIKNAVSKIEKHPELSKYLYPVFLVFGSKIKGYSKFDADLDLAIFIKSNVPIEKREEILELLYQEIPELANIDKIVEFWTEENNEKVGFKKSSRGIDTVVDASQINLLLGGAWIGNKNIIEKFYGRILKKYIDLDRFGNEKSKIRLHLLRQIELDVIQYRLMHKGYKRFYPIAIREKTTNSHLIDFQSDFYDSGFRRLASLLFISRVFLPDVKIKEN